MPVHWTVPPDVGYITVVARASAGGQDDDTAAPGRGALVTATLPVTPGETLEVYVADGESGFGHGGGHGTVPGTAGGHSGAGGGGASGIVGSAGALLVAGGGGGAGGAGTSSGDDSKGGPGGDGGTPIAWPGEPGFEGPSPNDHGLTGGCGGCMHETHGGGGDSYHLTGPVGGGGGGGGGWKGGAGGMTGWTGDVTQDVSIGGSGGGGGSSMVVAGALDVSYRNANTCHHRSAPGCQGNVVISWGGTPKQILAAVGNGQRTPAGGDFGALGAEVVDANGIPLSGETVTFSVSDEGPSGRFPGGRTTVSATTGPDGIATVEGLTANEISGEWDVTASLEGVPDPATFTLTNVPIVTATTIESSRDPSPTTGSPSFTATVQSARPVAPSGAVEFVLDGVPLAPAVALDADGTALLDAARVPALTPGTHVVAARYLGDAAHAESAASVEQHVVAAPTATTLAIDPNPSELGDSVTLTASVEAPDAGTFVPSGSVSFSTGAVDLGEAGIDGNGTAVLVTDALPLGSATVEAGYGGDLRFAGSTGAAVASVGDDVTATQLAADANPIGFGHPLTVRAAVSAATGPVSGGSVDFAVDGVAACTAVALSGGEAECALPPTLGAGSHEITAAFEPAGGSGDDPSEGALRVVVTPASTTTTVSVEPVPSVFAEPLSLRATVEASAPGIDLDAGTVQFAVDGDPVGAPVGLVDGVATLPAPCTGPLVPIGMPCPLENGPHVVEAAFTPAGVDVTPSRGTAIARVAAGPTTTSVSPSTNPVVTGAPLTLNATVTPAAGLPVLAGAVQFLVDGRALGDAVAVRNGRATSQPVTTLPPGMHTLDARYLGFGSFASSEASATVEVVPPPPPPPPPHVIPTPPQPPPLLRLRPRRVTVTAQGTFLVRARCRGGPGQCRGVLSLRRRGGARAELARRTLSLPSGSSSRHVLVDLNRRGEALLRSNPSIRAGWQRTQGVVPSRLRLDGSRARLIEVRGPLRIGAGGFARLRLHCAPGGPVHERHCAGEATIELGGRIAGRRPVRMLRGSTRTFMVALGRGARRAERVRVRALSDIPVGRDRVVVRTLAVSR